MRAQIVCLSLSISCCLQANTAAALNIPAAGSVFYKAAMAGERELTDELFIERAALGNLVEIELAKAALQKTRDPRIQSFAQRVIFDNGYAATELTDIAQTRLVQVRIRSGAIDVPQQMDAGGMDTLDRLNSLFGSDFDSAFSAHMYAMQTQAVSLFSEASHDPALQGVLRLFAIKTLSTLQSHQLAAADLAKKFAVSGEPLLRL